MKYQFDLPLPEIERLIDEWIPCARDREMLKCRLLDGLTFERLAEKFDLSVRHTKRIIYKSEDRLFNHK